MCPSKISPEKQHIEIMFETGFLTVPLQHQFSDVLGRRRSSFSTTNPEGDVSWRNIRTKSSRGSGN